MEKGKKAISKLKQKFWKEYTELWNNNQEAFELMRLIGVAQGKYLKEKFAE